MSELIEALKRARAHIVTLGSGYNVRAYGDAIHIAVLDQIDAALRNSQAASNEPAAWLVKWKGGGSAYFTSDDAKRAAENVNTYADYRPAEVVPVYYASSPPKSNIEQAKKSILAATIGSCDCGAKSPDAHWHLGHCRYLKLLQALDCLDASFLREEQR